ncbi:MAG TPA: double zinc ribbon domain-containing protein, partial [Azospirillaceae bacterium]|nr:double zinc ribbon domain-containing protein [Azospirillaceae bacterium]
MQRRFEIFNIAKNIGKLALNALLPPRCLACGTIVGDDGGLCVACWSSVAFIAEPVCDCCGTPLPYAAPAGFPEGALCADCVARRPLYTRARAALMYDDASKSLLLGFKHADRLHAAGAFAAWMARAGGDLLRDADLLIPIPLHGRRLFLRRYNQAAVLALALRRLTGTPAALNALERRRAT